MATITDERKLNVLTLVNYLNNVANIKVTHDEMAETIHTELVGKSDRMRSVKLISYNKGKVVTYGITVEQAVLIVNYMFRYIAGDTISWLRTLKPDVYNYDGYLELQEIIDVMSTERTAVEQTLSESIKLNDALSLRLKASEETLSSVEITLYNTDVELNRVFKLYEGSEKLVATLNKQLEEIRSDFDQAVNMCNDSKTTCAEANAKLELDLIHERKPFYKKLLG